MSLKLIRRAQIATTKHPEILVAEHVRDVLTKIRTDESSDPSMEITRDDYKHWMDTVLDIARERHITITKKSQLAEIAIDVLDNDPKVESQPGDKEALKMHIVATMWNAHAATVGHGRVQNTIQKAREEEEQSGFGQAFKAAQGVEDEQQASPLLKSAVGGTGETNPYMKGTLRYDLWQRLHQSAQENEEDSDVLPQRVAGEEDDTADVDGDDTATDDVDSSVDNETDAPVRGSDEFGDDDLENDVEEDSDDLLAEIPTEELEAELARRHDGDEDGDEDSDSDSADSDDDEGVVDATGEDMDADSEDLPRDDTPRNKRTPADASADIDLDKDDESADDIASRIAHEEEEHSGGTSNFFRKVVTAPVEHFKKALADVHSEGQKAWYHVRMPKNPHPKGSHAHRQWQKGFEKEAKASLGFKENKPLSTSKQKKKR